MTKTATVDAGYLSGAHLGFLVSFQVAGAAVTGIVRSVSHAESVIGREWHTVNITLSKGEDRRNYVLRSTIPVDMSSEVPA